jgi:hypothetical protein
VEVVAELCKKLGVQFPLPSSCEFCVGKSAIGKVPCSNGL